MAVAVGKGTEDLLLTSRVGEGHRPLGYAERLKFSFSYTVFEVDKGITDAHELY